MRIDERIGGVLLRLYAIGAAVLLVLVLPMAVARLGTLRLRDLAVPLVPSTDGSIDVTVGTEHLHLLEVSIDGNRPIRAGSLAFLRQVQSLPAGTTLEYRGTGRVRDSVRNVPAPPSQTVKQLIAIVIGATFAVFGLGIAIAATDKRSQVAAAALTGVGLLFAPLLLEATASAIHDASARSLLLIVWQSFPRPLALFWIPLFAASFPRPLQRRPAVLRVALSTTCCVAIVLTLIESADQIPALTDHCSLLAQRVLMVTGRVTQYVAYGLSLVTTLIAIYGQARARGALPKAERNRMAVVWHAVLFGLGIPFPVGIVQIAGRLVLHRNIIPAPVMVSLFVTLLLIPPAVTYAARARRVDTVRLLVQRAVLFSFAVRTIRIASLIPVLVLIVIVIRHRDQSMAATLVEHPLAVLLAAAVSIGSPRFAEALHTRVEALFFRDRVDLRTELGVLVERLNETATVEELASLLEREVERMLRLESASLFWRESATAAFAREACTGSSSRFRQWSSRSSGWQTSSTSTLRTAGHFRRPHPSSNDSGWRKRTSTFSHRSARAASSRHSSHSVRSGAAFHSIARIASF